MPRRAPRHVHFDGHSGVDCDRRLLGLDEDRGHLVVLVALSKVDVTSSMFSVEFVCLRDSGRYKAGHSWMYTIEGEEQLGLDTSARYGYGWARQEIGRANSFLECRHSNTRR